MNNTVFKPTQNVTRTGSVSRGPQIPLGTAGWSDGRRMEPFSATKGDFWLGWGADGQSIGSRDDRHILVIGGNRSGKGISTLLTNLILWRGSTVVIDPKGENAMVALSRRGKGSRYARGLGQPTYLLDPYHEVHTAERDFSEYRACFNPLDALNPKGKEAVPDAGRIADALVEIEASREPYWEQSARTLIRNLILHVLTWRDFRKEQRNLVTVRRLLLAGDWEKRKLVAMTVEDGKAPSGYQLLFDAMQRNEAFGGVISDAGSHYGDQLKNAPRAFASIVAVAAKALDFLDDEQMRATLSRSDFRLADLKTSPRGMSLFLSLPQRLMETHYGWLRLMSTLVITEMERVKGRPACGLPILLVLDEFPALKRMRVIENAAAQIAGAGVRMVFVAQTLAQLKDIYKDDWETMVANAGAKLFFGNDDHFTREYVSKLVGEVEVVRMTDSASLTEGRFSSVSESLSFGMSRNLSDGHSSSMTEGGRGTSTSFSINGGHGSGQSFGYSTAYASGQNTSHTAGRAETIHKRPLVTPDEVGRIFGDRSMQRGLLLLSGQQPIAITRGYYFANKNLRGLYDPHRDFPPPPTLAELEPIVAREKREALEVEERRRLEKAAAEETKRRERLLLEAQRREKWERDRPRREREARRERRRQVAEDVLEFALNTFILWPLEIGMWLALFALAGGAGWVIALIGRAIFY